MKALNPEFFARNGYLRLPAVHSKAHLSGVRQELLSEIARLERAGSLRSVRRLPVFQQIVRLSTLVRVARLQEVVMTPPLIDAIRLLGGRRPSQIQQAQLLLSPSLQGAGTFDRLNWHVDVSGSPKSATPGIQAFFLLDDVAPRGGATLALAGSHHFHGLEESPLRQALRTTHDLDERLHDLGVSMVEMSGRAGDVFLMDMRVLHSPSANETRHVRMMATCRCLL